MTVPFDAMSAQSDSRAARQEGFDKRVRTVLQGDLTARSISTVQVNIGLRCNLACHHCHVESSPKRVEQMTEETMGWVLRAARRSNARTMDITGGAPEMHPHFKTFVRAVVDDSMRVLVRTNLTILGMKGYEELPEFFAEHGVHLVASLPCYLEENVHKQRGMHVYKESIEAVQRLNDVGYGHEPHLSLDLVYNPGGPALPPSQHTLEEAYRMELRQRFDITFNALLTITNMPIGRFQSDLKKQGRAQDYRRLLHSAFNAATLDGLMCRHQLHVGWDGTVYDCDFNYALGMSAMTSPLHIRDFHPDDFLSRTIRTGPHCYGCTAGSGSSCKGALT